MKHIYTYCHFSIVSKYFADFDGFGVFFEERELFLRYLHFFAWWFWVISFVDRVKTDISPTLYSLSNCFLHWTEQLLKLLYIRVIDIWQLGENDLEKLAVAVPFAATA